MSVVKSLTQEERADTLHRVSNMKLAELKDLCKAMGFRVGGKKVELQERIQRYFLNAFGDQDYTLGLAMRALVLKRDAGETLPRIQDLYSAIQRGDYQYSASTPADRVIPSYNPALNHAPRPNISKLDSEPYRGHSLYFKASPFYKLKKFIPGSPQLLAPKKTRENAEFKFVLGMEDLSALRSNPETVRIYLLCGELLVRSISTSNAQIDYPTPVEVRANGTVITQSFKGIKGKPGTAKPVDLTSHIKLTQAQNKVSILYYNTTEHYLAYIYIVQTVSCETLIQEIEFRAHIHHDDTIQKIKSEIEDDDIVVSNASVTLRDPLSYTKMKYPVQSIYCKHTQCFDGMVFLQSQLQIPTWICPHCQIPININDLAISDYFLQILSSVEEDIDQVTLNDDGTWKVVIPKEESPSKKEEKVNAKVIQEEIEIISLSSDSEDEKEVAKPTSAVKQSVVLTKPQVPIPTVKPMEQAQQSIPARSDEYAPPRVMGSAPPREYGHASHIQPNEAVHQNHFQGAPVPCEANGATVQNTSNSRQLQNVTQSNVVNHSSFIPSPQILNHNQQNHMNRSLHSALGPPTASTPIYPQIPSEEMLFSSSNRGQFNRPTQPSAMRNSTQNVFATRPTQPSIFGNSAPNVMPSYNSNSVGSEPVRSSNSNSIVPRLPSIYSQMRAPFTMHDIERALSPREDVSANHSNQTSVQGNTPNNVINESTNVNLHNLPNNNSSNSLFNRNQMNVNNVILANKNSNEPNIHSTTADLNVHESQSIAPSSISETSGGQKTRHPDILPSPSLKAVLTNDATSESSRSKFSVPIIGSHHSGFQNSGNTNNSPILPTPPRRPQPNIFIPSKKPRPFMKPKETIVLADSSTESGLPNNLSITASRSESDQPILGVPNAEILGNLRKNLIESQLTSENSTHKSPPLQQTLLNKHVANPQFEESNGELHRNLPPAIQKVSTDVLDGLVSNTSKNTTNYNENNNDAYEDDDEVPLARIQRGKSRSITPRSNSSIDGGKNNERGALGRTYQHASSSTSDLGSVGSALKPGSISNTNFQPRSSILPTRLSPQNSILMSNNNPIPLLQSTNIDPANLVQALNTQSGTLPPKFFPDRISSNRDSGEQQHLKERNPSTSENSGVDTLETKKPSPIAAKPSTATDISKVNPNRSKEATGGNKFGPEEIRAQTKAEFEAEVAAIERAYKANKLRVLEATTNFSGYPESMRHTLLAQDAQAKKKHLDVLFHKKDVALKQVRKNCQERLTLRLLQLFAESTPPNIQLNAAGSVRNVGVGSLNQTNSGSSGSNGLNSSLGVSSISPTNRTELGTNQDTPEIPKRKKVKGLLGIEIDEDVLNTRMGPGDSFSTSKSFSAPQRIKPTRLDVLNTIPSDWNQSILLGNSEKRGEHTKSTEFIDLS